MSPQELSNLLWRERELLSHLLYKLKVEQMLLNAGETRFLPKATAESEEVLMATREASLARDVAAQSVATMYGLPEDAGLRDIAMAAPADTPWPEIFTKHLAAITNLVNEIRQVRDSNASIVAHATRSTQETLANLGVREVTTYDATGAATAEPARSRLFDTTL